MKAGISYYEPNQTTSLLDIIINVCYCMVEIWFFSITFYRTIGFKLYFKQGLFCIVILRS